MFTMFTLSFVRSRVRKFRFGQEEDEDEVDYNLRLQQLALSAKTLDKELETRIGRSNTSTT